MRRLLVFAFCSVLLLPASHAADDGTEELPELTDPRDDVGYDPLYLGEDHAYLDLLSAWFEYDASTDEVVLTTKVTSTVGLENPPEGWFILCNFGSFVYVDETKMGLVAFQWSIAQNGTERTVVYFSDESGAAGYSPSDETTYLPHAYEIVLAEPGYHRFAVSRAELLRFGVSLADLHGYCYDSFQAALYDNRDSAGSESVYNLEGLTPQAFPDADEDPLSPSEAPDAGDAGLDQPTSGIIGFGVLACVIVAALLRGRRPS